MYLLSSRMGSSILLCLAIAGLLSGCTTQELQLPISIPILEDYQDTIAKQSEEKDNLNKLVSILQYEKFIHELQAEDLELERNRLETSLDTATDVALVKLALLYSHKDAPFHNATRAQQLLQKCTDNNGGTTMDIRSFSNLILELLAETTAQQKALKKMRNALSDERSQKKMLEEQLDELKAIEESINRRTHQLSETGP